MTGECSPADVMRPRDGSTWQIGTAAEVDWISTGTSTGLAITSAIPPVFPAYATVAVPDPDIQRQARDRALLDVLGRHSTQERWWLGYLDTGGSDVVFADAPMVTLYADWQYVLVSAGQEQAARWRLTDHWKDCLPDLMFPADRSWLVSTLWDDDWTCVGGPEQLIAGLLSHPDLQDDARRVTADEEDATPPGHQAL
jgi:hypothetical protein